MWRSFALAAVVAMFATRAAAYHFVQGISLGFPVELPSIYFPIRIAHSSLACTAFVILFPMGGLIIRWIPTSFLPRAHAAVQIFAYITFTTAVGLGIWMARGGGILNRYHPIIGLTIFSLTTIQILLGSRNHYVHVQSRGHETLLRVPLGTFHVWFGRFLITFGILQGGCGLMFSNSAARGARIAYGVIAGIVWVVFVVGNLLAWEYFKPPTGFSLKGPRVQKSRGEAPTQERLQEEDGYEKRV